MWKIGVQGYQADRHSASASWHDRHGGRYKANPSLGQTIQIQRVRDAFQEALDNPAEENVFKQFYKLLMEGRIVHGGNPIMAWMAGNVVVDTDPAGNIKPTKAKSPEKIDGIVAAIMALDRCIRNEGQQQGSVYDERDMIVF